MKTLNEWFQKPLGKAVAEGVQKQWDSFELLSSSFYGECLQIGTHVSLSPMKKVTVLTHKMTLGTQIIAPKDDLPFMDESFSAIVLPFTLETTQNIYHFMNEIKRVLVPDGLVCIIGVNPFSLWGGARLFHAKTMQPLALRHSYTSLRAYSLLATRGFHLYGIKSFFYRPPFSSIKLLKQMRFLEPVGQMFWPYPGGLYFLLAQKVTPQFLKVQPLWQTGGYVFGKA